VGIFLVFDGAKTELKEGDFGEEVSYATLGGGAKGEQR